jgi:uncharacterized cofD-like protein
MRSIVTIGGGTGQFTLLSGLKKYPVRLTAIVSMSDNGGSTGVLRDELGVLPPGDVRQCLTALSESDLLLRNLFNYRFDQGGMSGHNFGNLFLSALEKITGSFEEAVKVASSVLAIRGEVIPVTTKKVSLVCGTGASESVGEHAIDTGVIERSTLRLEPEAYANPKAVAAIEGADCIVVGPGDLYTSIIPNLLARGLASAINQAKAPVVYNCNLMNKPGHTDGFGVIDYMNEIERFIGAGRINCVTFNDRRPASELLNRYLNAEGRTPVPAPTETKNSTAKFFGAGLVDETPIEQKSGDKTPRTYIRHDTEKLAALIIEKCLGGI